MKNKKRIRKYKKHGIGLVGIMLTLLIVGSITSGLIYTYNEYKIQEKGRLSGEQIRNLGQAVDEYISINRDKIANLQSDGNIRCQANGFCELTVAGLRRTGELPNSFNDKNVWGSEYKIQIKREGVPPDYKISGIVVTTSEPPKSLVKILGTAVQSGGANAGNNLTDIQKMSGNSGAWSYTKSDFNIISNTEYQLSYRIGYNASQYSPYLRRDGSLPMTGHLDMAGHNINNINYMNANTGQFNGNLSVNGDGYVGGKLTSDLIPKQTVVQGQGCSPNGLIAKTSNGRILSCVDGRYSRADEAVITFYGSVGRGGSMNLGRHSYCAIARVGNAEDGHYCQVSYNNGIWWKSEYKTGCQAYCMN